MMKTNYILDVDGTLTPSRERIDPDFEKFFIDFCDTNKVYLITGSDREKTLEQVGEEVYNRCVRVYQCSGNDVWCKDEHIRSSNWKLDEEEEQYLIDELHNSPYPVRTGKHIEVRPGMVNFSIVGRNASPKERTDYYEYDKQKGERNRIAKDFNVAFPHLEARPGGETGIDISKKGNDKSQILQDIEGPVLFFGDRCDETGNDYPLASKVPHHNVKDWKETYELLKRETV